MNNVITIKQDDVKIRKQFARPTAIIKDKTKYKRKEKHKNSIG